MNQNQFEHWLRNIQKTKEREISCSECFDLVSRFVDLEISGQDAVAKMPELRQHLDQCRACRDEYESLRNLRLLEEKAGLPSLDDLRGLIQ